jgi:hypothetical protein
MTSLCTVLVSGAALVAGCGQSGDPSPGPGPSPDPAPSPVTTGTTSVDPPVPPDDDPSVESMTRPIAVGSAQGVVAMWVADAGSDQILDSPDFTCDQQLSRIAWHCYADVAYETATDPKQTCRLSVEVWNTIDYGDDGAVRDASECTQALGL